MIELLYKSFQELKKAGNSMQKGGSSGHGL